MIETSLSRYLQFERTGLINSLSFLTYRIRATIPTTTANPTPLTLRPAPAVTIGLVAEVPFDGTVLPLVTTLAGDTLERLYVFVAVLLYGPTLKLDGAGYCGPGAPALFAASGTDEAPTLVLVLLLLLLLLVGTVTNTVLRTCVVRVRIPLVVVSGEDPTRSGLEPELDPVLSLPEPSDPDDPDSEPVLPLSLPLPLVDPEPVVPVSAGEEELVKVIPDTAAVTGHTVVVIAMISVVTEPIRAGQSVMVAAHEVTV